MKKSIVMTKQVFKRTPAKRISKWLAKGFSVTVR